MSEEFLLIVTSDTDDATSIEGIGERGWGQVREKLNKAAEIPISVLEKNMNSFLQMTGRLFKQVDKQFGEQSDLRLNEVELQLEISGKGEVKLFAGGEASGKGVITLKFKRSQG
jgi:hypothetical protein